MSGEGVKVIQAYNNLNAASSRGMLLLLFVDTTKGFVGINFDYRPRKIFRMEVLFQSTINICIICRIFFLCTDG